MGAGCSRGAEGLRQKSARRLEEQAPGGFRLGSSEVPEDSPVTTVVSRVACARALLGLGGRQMVHLALGTVLELVSEFSMIKDESEG